MLNKDYENKESAVRNMVVLSEQVHLDDDGHVLNRSLSNSVYQAFPGVKVSYQARATIRKGRQECDEPVDVTNVDVSPKEDNKRDLYLSSTYFTRNGGGKLPANFTDIEDGTLNLVLWNPGVLEYVLTMSGTIKCFSEVHKVAPVIRIRLVSFSSALNTALSACHHTSYQGLSNIAQRQCVLSVLKVTNDEKPPVKGINGFVDSASEAQFGFMQLVLGKAWLSESSNPLGPTKVLFSTKEAQLLDCRVEQNGTCISPAIDVRGGQLSNQEFFTNLTMFLPPYSSDKSCDYGSLEVVHRYETGFVYALYLMVKLGKLEANDTFWVPFDRVVYSPVINSTCPTANSEDKKACGQGLGILGKEDDQFSNSWDVGEDGNKNFSLLLDFKWKSDFATIPTWTGNTLQISPSRIALAAYFEGSTGNSWIVCPNTAVEEQVLEEGLPLLDGDLVDSLYPNAENKFSIQGGSVSVDEFLEI